MTVSFHDFFMGPPAYMTISVVILIIFELILVFFFFKRNPYIYRNIRIKILNSLQKLTFFCCNKENPCILIISNFLHKTPKPLPNKKVDISINNEETHEQFLYEQISEKFVNKMEQIDMQDKSEVKSHSQNNRESRSYSIGNIQDDSINERLLPSA